jgi:hypothetical protein
MNLHIIGLKFQHKLLSAIELVCPLNLHDAPVKHLAGDHCVTMVTGGSQVTEVRAKEEFTVQQSELECSLNKPTVI